MWLAMAPRGLSNLTLHNSPVFRVLLHCLDLVSYGRAACNRELRRPEHPSAMEKWQEREVRVELAGNMLCAPRSMSMQVQLRWGGQAFGRDAIRRQVLNCGAWPPSRKPPRSERHGRTKQRRPGRIRSVFPCWCRAAPEEDLVRAGTAGTFLSLPSVSVVLRSLSLLLWLSVKVFQHCPLT